jgi:hypothetical protein
MEAKDGVRVDLDQLRRWREALCALAPLRPAAHALARPDVPVQPDRQALLAEFDERHAAAVATSARLADWIDRELGDLADRVGEVIEGYAEAQREMGDLLRAIAHGE